MEIKILQVFYGTDGLPYKDQERSVHFPILGAGFQGASNTTQIKFYYGDLGDASTTWVATTKLPNGRIGSKVLTTYYDSDLAESYALLEMDTFYFQYKGDVFISLQGYQGGVTVSYDEDEELYTVSGTPTIQATGSIKISVNYATQFVGSGEEENADLQSIMAALGDKLSLSGGTMSGPIIQSNYISLGRASGSTIGDLSSAMGGSVVASGYASHAEGAETQATGGGSHAEGLQTLASADRSHAEGYGTQATGGESHAEGKDTVASGYISHAEGYNTTASGPVSHSEGASTTASGDYSHSEGGDSVASGTRSHAEGYLTTASGNNGSHSEGRSTLASGQTSHAEGYSTTASGTYSHAENIATTASGYASHAEGNDTDATGNYSHSEGTGTAANGVNSHAEGYHTVASSDNQHVSGKYNIADSNNTYAEIIGNGSGDNARSNARTLDWDGNEILAGTIYVNGDKEIATKEYVSTTISSAYIYKGSLTVAQVNALNTSSLSVGWVYNVSDAGTITLGSISVLAGDNIAWTGSAWDKLAGTVNLENYVQKTDEADLVYGTDENGNQTTIDVDTYLGNIVRRNSDNSIVVPATPTNSTDATSKSYVDTLVSSTTITRLGDITSDIVLDYVGYLEDEVVYTAIIDSEQYFVKVHTSGSSTYVIIWNDSIKAIVPTTSLTNETAFDDLSSYFSTYSLYKKVDSSITIIDLLGSDNTNLFSLASSGYAEYIFSSGYDGTTYSFECECLYDNRRWVKTFDNITDRNNYRDSTTLAQFMIDANRDDYALEGEVLKNYATDSTVWDTTPTQSSTKPVTSGGIWSAINSVAETAEGRCKTYILRYSMTYEDLQEECQSGYDSDVCYDINGNNVTQAVADGEYGDGDEITIDNGLFNSQDDTIVLVDDEYLIFSSTATSPQFIIAKVGDIVGSLFKEGDIILVVETDVPDRWFGGEVSQGVRLYKLETTKVDLTNYYTKSEDLIPDESDTYLLGSSSYPWNGLYLGTGSIFFNNYNVLSLDSSNRLNVNYQGNTRLKIDGSDIYAVANFSPDSNNTYDLGNSSAKWKDLYLGGTAYLGANTTLQDTGSNFILAYSGNNIFYANNSYIQANRTFIPVTNNSRDLGSSSYAWKDLYLSGAIKGAATITQDEYDALVDGGTVDADTFYFIEEE